MKQRARIFPLPFLAFTLALCLMGGLLTLFSTGLPAALHTEVPVTAPRVCTVVLDAGHGGEDGGASTADGVHEKDLNLAIVLLLRDLLEANGVKVVLTRETDTLLYDRNADYDGHKKALDFAARKKIAEETEDAVFVSIHMNTYPRADCTGLQVWYSPNHEESRGIAEEIQSTAVALLQPQNKRTVRAAGSNIYLLHHLEVPAVLVECGFLSSPEEAALLCNADYQKQLAYTVFSALLRTGYFA